MARAPARGSAPARLLRARAGFTGRITLRWAALRVLALAVFLGAWWAVTALHVWSELFVPTPDR